MGVPLYAILLWVTWLLIRSAWSAPRAADAAAERVRYLDVKINRLGCGAADRLRLALLELRLRRPSGWQKRASGHMPEETIVSINSFSAKDTLTVGETDYEIFRIDTVPGYEKLPFSLKVLLENLLRTEDGANVTKAQIEALGSWNPDAEPDTEIQFTPARVVMQDFTGVPCIVDLATMREAVTALGGDADKINPLSPAEMVIDHSVIADLFGTENALERNVEIEYERNGERYQFLRWGQTAFEDFKVVPPGTGIVHQVNIEHLAKVIYDRPVDGVLRAYPDTCVGTDSHTTMVNGLGVLGWGVGGIEAEAAMLGQPVSMLIPRVVGFKLTGEIPAGVTATDVVLTITAHAAQARRGRQVRRVLRSRRRLGAAREPRHHRQHEPRVRLDGRDVPHRRRHARLPAPHRPQRRVGRPRRGVREAADAVARRLPPSPPSASTWSSTSARSCPSIAGPKRPQDRILLSEAKSQFEQDILNYATPQTSEDLAASSRSTPSRRPTPASPAGRARRARVRAHLVAAAPPSASKPVKVTTPDGS